MFAQCTLKKKLSETSAIIEVSWIPVKFAKKGKFLKLKRNKKWDNGWEVIAVGSKQETTHSQEYKQVPTYEQK